VRFFFGCSFLVVVDGTLVKTSIPTIAARGQVVHTLATRMGSKTKWDEKYALAFTIIKNCLQIIMFLMLVLLTNQKRLRVN
jgi:Na+/H+ antiporter NhaC